MLNPHFKHKRTLLAPVRSELCPSKHHFLSLCTPPRRSDYVIEFLQKETELATRLKKGGSFPICIALNQKIIFRGLDLGGRGEGGGGGGGGGLLGIGVGNVLVSHPSV